MATTVDKYIAGCQEVFDAKPTYKNGKSNLTECDCIGMDKYAFRKAGVSLSSSGTNYTARKQVNCFRKINSVDTLMVGDVVFKAHEPGETGYDLPDKYKEGGAEYNGDLRDYYHIGTVKSVNPLRILHMTSPTAKEDTKLGKWGFTASWKAQYIDYGVEPEPEPEPIIMPDTAVVWSENGRPVNLRQRASKAAALVERIKVGETVEVLENGDVWCRIKWKNKSGYMMTEFLVFPDEVLYMITIPHLTKEQAEALMQMYPGAEMIDESGWS